MWGLVIAETGYTATPSWYRVRLHEVGTGDYSLRSIWLI